jgi:dTDP-4-dehydrorhamnose 3,5-epimerase
MKVIKTEFDDLFILEPKVLGDDRGYFFESYNHKVFSDNGLANRFVQDNQSKSKKGVLRGLHYQNAPYSQSKLIRVLSGSILDIVLDVRKEKPTFGKFFSLELSSEDKRQLFVPKGFAHGFLVLSDFAEVLYKTDEFYNQDSEGGINFFDPTLKLKNILNGGDFLLSEKDRRLPDLMTAKFNF